MSTLLVAQGSRNRVREKLKEAKVTITREGYSDSSTTTWAFICSTRKTPAMLQELAWTVTGWADAFKKNLEGVGRDW